MKIILQTPTPSLAKSKEFYEKLNFSVIEHPQGLIVSDNVLSIFVNTIRFARAGMILYVEDPKRTSQEINEKFFVTKTEGGFLSVCPSGSSVYILQNKDKPDHLNLSEESSFLGNNAGLSLESNDMNSSVLFYLSLGFNITSGSADDGWIGMSHASGFGLSIMKTGMCPHLFFNPSLSFFNGKEGNPIVINRLRKLGIPIREEITYFNKNNEVDNVIVTDPGGLGFFIFND